MRWQSLVDFLVLASEAALRGRSRGAGFGDESGSRRARAHQASRVPQDSLVRQGACGRTPE